MGRRETTLTMPPYLDAEARRVWDELTPQLDALGVLAAIDAHALGRYCVTYCEWVRAIEQVRREGQAVAVLDKAGAVKRWRPHPACALSLRLSAALLRLEQDFGMTPSARARGGLSLEPDKDEDDFDFNGGPVLGTIGEADNGTGSAG